MSSSSLQILQDNSPLLTPEHWGNVWSLLLESLMEKCKIFLISDTKRSSPGGAGDSWVSAGGVGRRVEEWQLDLDKPIIFVKFNVDRIFLSLNGEAYIETVLAVSLFRCIRREVRRTILSSSYLHFLLQLQHGLSDDVGVRATLSLLKTIVLTGGDTHLLTFSWASFCDILEQSPSEVRSRLATEVWRLSWAEQDNCNSKWCVCLLILRVLHCTPGESRPGVLSSSWNKELNTPYLWGRKMFQLTIR